MSSDPNSATRRIRVLSQDVIDRIAAGEVVQRPASVVKELVENSLDAGATHIAVTFDPKRMTISDNGCGIAVEDLPLAVVRHATSKLTTTDDFDNLQSFGFRGEALASVSLVSKLTIISRTLDQKVAFRQHYQGTSSLNKPQATARTVGTTITIQDLFYNLPQRQKQRTSDEYNRILVVVQHYAMLYATHGVTFSLERSLKGKSSVDLNTASMVRKNPDGIIVGGDWNAAKQVMGHVFGASLVPALRHFSTQLLAESAGDKEPGSSNTIDSIDVSNDGVQSYIYRAQGLLSTPSHAHNNKRTECILFINQRRVECPPLQRAIQDLYATFAKVKPVLLLNLTVPPSEIDVNVHPTKHQVTLLHMETIQKHLVQVIREQLHDAGQTFGVAAPSQPNQKKRPSSSGGVVPPAQKVRTSNVAPAGALEPFVLPQAPQSGSVDMTQPGAFVQALQQPVRLARQAIVRPRKISPSTCSYDSIRSLRRRIDRASTDDLQKQMRSSVFVGVVSHQRSLLQCEQELVLVNHWELTAELFYQLAVLRFGEVPAARLGDGVDVRTLIEQHLELSNTQEEDDDSGNQPNKLDAIVVSETHVSMAQQAAELLWQKAEMLQEYFAIGFEQSTEKQRLILKTLPELTEGYIPQPHGLPSFLLRLATEVNWHEEKACFHDVSRQLGLYYAQVPTIHQDWHHHVRHVLFPALSTLLVPPQRLRDDGHWEVLTRLSKLYRVFERC